MSDATLEAIRDIIQEDVGNRGLRTDPEDNLITHTAGDFAAACRSIAQTPNASVAVVTGFYIPHAEPPCGETDGPLGALFLARALTPLEIKVVLVTDEFCRPALEAGLAAAGLTGSVPLVLLPSGKPAQTLSAADYRRAFADRAGPLTHLIALERVGPSHTPESLRAHPATTPEVVEQFHREVPADRHGRCHTMRGRDITAHMSPAHLPFEAGGTRAPRPTTIGIGDGGNEIGMGKVPWDVVRRNIPGGGLVACRVPCEHLIVCGVSNWGAYGLAAGIRLLRGAKPDAELFEPERERELLRVMVEQGPLVDGVTGKPTVTVDGLDFEGYAELLRRLGAMRSPPLRESKGSARLRS
jgi:hypothetical protein